MKKRALVACEYSGVVREALIRCGWDAISCDLLPTNIVDGRINRVHRMPPGPDRWKERSRTYTGIAQGMAEQWTKFIEQ